MKKKNNYHKQAWQDSKHGQLNCQALAYIISRGSSRSSIRLFLVLESRHWSWELTTGTGRKLLLGIGFCQTLKKWILKNVWTGKRELYSLLSPTPNPKFQTPLYQLSASVRLHGFDSNITDDRVILATRLLLSIKILYSHSKEKIVIDQTRTWIMPTSLAPSPIARVMASFTCCLTSLTTWAFCRGETLEI